MKISALANEYIPLMKSPDSKTVFTCSPGLCVCPDGRMIATGGFRGPGIDKVEGIKCGSHQGQIFISDDHGTTWEKNAEYPFLHARPFIAGDKIYILGHDGDLMIMSSDDWGTTWNEPVKLTDGERWHQAPCNVIYANGCVYLVMERVCDPECDYWVPSVLAPVLMRAKVEDDLTVKANWDFASEVMFRDVFPDKDIIERGMSFYPIIPKTPYYPAPGRDFAPPGWLETNVFQVNDPKHYWYDPEMKTFHLVARLHNGATGYAAMLTVKETGEKPGTGKMITGFQKLPSGGECRFLPMPGGHMKFHILFDEETSLYWLLGSQPTDSLTRCDLLEEDRFMLPNNQRSRLVLHFSRNMVDWCFAGLVAAGNSEIESRHYASMVIDGDDLCVLSRSGDETAQSAHDGNLITFHKIENFRNLIY